MALITFINLFGDLASDARRGNYFSLLGYVIGMLFIPLMIFFFAFLIPHRRGKKIKNYTIIYNVLIGQLILYSILPILLNQFVNPEISSCESPYQWIHGKCCLPSKEYGAKICLEDEELLFTKLNDAIDNEQYTTGAKFSHENPSFSFTPPPEYLYVKDLNQGSTIIPYRFYATGETEFDTLEIVVMYVYDNFDDYTDKEIEKLTFKGLFSGLSDVSQMLSVEWIVNSEGNRVLVFEYESQIETMKHLSKGALFYNSDEKLVVLLRFTAPEDYYGHVDEFDEMIDSFKFN